MNIKWYLNRLRLMSNREHIYRMNELLCKVILNRLRIFEWKRGFYIFFYDPILDKIKWDLQTLKYLSKIKDKKLRLFAVDVNPLKIDSWRKDYKNDIVSPIKYYASINRQNFKEIGDIKYVAELNRLYHFPVMASYIVSNQDYSILNILSNQISEWLEQNPFLYSINWTSGIEVAIRAVNITFAYLILRYFGFISSELERKIFQILNYSFLFIKNHLSLYSSANNHLTAELMGLIVISCIFKFKNSDKQCNKYLNMLFNELKRQIHEDGFTKEQATRYHAEVFDHFLISFRCAELADKSIPKWCYEKLFRMAEILSYFNNSNGLTIEVGDSDQGCVIYPYNDEEFDIYTSVLNSASFLNQKYMYTPNISIDLKNYLLFGENFRQFIERTRNQKNVNIIKKETRLFQHSGYLFILDGSIKFIFDIGPLGLDPLAAHGHADVLNFILEVDNIPIIIDPGTFQYHSIYKKWRNYFRGTRAHNTISIDNKDQGKIGGRMMWLTKPDVKLISFFKGKNIIKCVAEHNGFCKQGIPIVHRRAISYYADSKNICIEDYLLFDDRKVNKHYAEFYLHFFPDLKVTHKNNNIILSLPSNKTIIIENSQFIKGYLVYGNDQLPLGWYSPGFDIKKPTFTFYLKDEVTTFKKFTTVIKILS